MQMKYWYTKKLWTGILIVKHVQYTLVAYNCVFEKQYRTH